VRSRFYYPHNAAEVTGEPYPPNWHARHTRPTDTHAPAATVLPMHQGGRDRDYESGSFAHLRFQDATHAELELIGGRGQVLYQLKKRNPLRSSPAGTSPAAVTTDPAVVAGMRYPVYVPPQPVAAGAAPSMANFVSQLGFASSPRS
jgi:hypothetical protein